jgi:hypothetical protein
MDIVDAGDGAGSRCEVSLGCQLLERLHDDAARHAEVGGEGAGGGKWRSRTEAAGSNGGPQAGLELSAPATARNACQVDE